VLGAIVAFLLLGPIWSAWRQLWGLAAAHLLLAVGLALIAGPLAILSTLVLVWFVPTALRSRYLHAGWRAVAPPARAQARAPAGAPAAGAYVPQGYSDEVRKVSQRVTIDR
jgi:hypothetical protein